MLLVQWLRSAAVSYHHLITGGCQIVFWVCAGEQYGCIGFSAAQRTSAERCQQFGSHCLTQGQAKITVAPTCTFDVAVELFPCHQIAFGVHSIHFVQLESWSLIPTHELHWILFATPLSLSLNSAFHSMSNSFFATDCSIGFYVQLFLCH